jgi:hypothetical protein
MAGDETMWWYGFGLSLALGLTMLIPFWRGRSDALTAWNLLLLGSIIHVGVGFMEVYAKQMHWPELKWFTPSSHEKRWLMMGTTVFYLSLLFFHYKVKFPARLLQNRFAKWPELSAGVVVFVMTICVGISAIMPFVQNVPFLREVTLNFSHSALAIGVTFATVYWLKNRLSPFALMLMIAAFAIALIESMVTFAGRRLLLTVAFGPIAACYWISWRYWSRTKLVVAFGGLAAGILILSAFYATFRHMKEERSASNVLAKAQSVTVEDIEKQLADMYHYLAQYTVHYALLTIRLTDEGRTPVIPLDALRQIATYPIPRSMWRDKPRDILLYLSTDVLHMPYKTNWGIAVPGQGYHDGGVAALVLYAFLICALMFVFDVPLAREPDNPFILAALASSSAHIAAWPRGSISAMALNMFESIALVLVLAYACRMLFGTARNYTTGYGWRAPAYYPPQ